MSGEQWLRINIVNTRQLTAVFPTTRTHTEGMHAAVYKLKFYKEQ